MFNYDFAILITIWFAFLFTFMKIWGYDACNGDDDETIEIDPR